MSIPIYDFFERTGTIGFLLKDTDLRAGYRVVATLAERDNIAISARALGMKVFVQADSNEYQLQRTLANSGWTNIKASIGKITAKRSLRVTDKLRQMNAYQFETWAQNHLITWFNALPSATRVIDAPVTVFRVSYEQGGLAPVYAEADHVQDQQFYVGDATFLFIGTPSGAAISLDASMLFAISKSLIPLGDSVESAMNEYATRKAAEAP